MQQTAFSQEIITLDASPKSSMQWQDARKDALNAVAKGRTILWHLDFGLFSNLSASLSNTSQFMTLRLAIDHFRDTLWAEFQRYSQGLVLYKGTADFSDNFPWDEEQKLNFKGWLNDASAEEDEFLTKMFCRDVCAAYISQLAENAPDRIPLFIMFENATEDPLLQVLLTQQDLYPRLTVLQSKVQNPNARVAICWPLNDKKKLCYFEALKGALQKLQLKGIDYRIISEANLTSDWHGLDHIIYSPLSISASGIRKLQGFQAAEGTVVTVGEFFGFPQEISFDNFLSLSV